MTDVNRSQCGKREIFDIDSFARLSCVKIARNEHCEGLWVTKEISCEKMTTRNEKSVKKQCYTDVSTNLPKHTEII
jgi:hypothetical protein